MTYSKHETSQYLKSKGFVNHCSCNSRYSFRGCEIDVEMRFCIVTFNGHTQTFTDLEDLKEHLFKNNIIKTV